MEEQVGVPALAGIGQSAPRPAEAGIPSGQVGNLSYKGKRFRAVPSLVLGLILELLAAQGSTGAPSDLASLPPAIATEVGQIESAHRAILRGRVAGWRLGPIRQRYEAMLRRGLDPTAATIVHERLDEVARHAEMAESARTIEALLQQSRVRDEKMASQRRRLLDAERPSERPYTEQGLAQPSSKRYRGQKLVALIGPRGETLTYLSLPDGLDPKPFFGHRVGVRGSLHYREDLLNRLIFVRDIETLDQDPRVQSDR